jgi:poly(hydroxyalkanoate) depolymerase family esterase
MKINESFLAQMREAAELLQTSGPMAATEAIQRALHGGSVPDADASASNASQFFTQQPELHDINPPPSSSGAAPQAKTHAFHRGPLHTAWKGASARQPIEDVDLDLAGKGRFVSGSCTNRAGTRTYKLYIPSRHVDRDKGGVPLPLVVMLHGCKQHPDDFAAGTGMNAAAEEHGCLVVYPAQVQSANGSNCWNWFKHEEQRRDRGEPSIIADITREIIRTHNVDPARVYVAGLSAGGAMAAVMGATYPELYAAIGVHSGLPYGVARDMPSAFAVMRNTKAKEGPLAANISDPVPLAQPIPSIVFHGDRDATVHPSNGDKVLSQCVSHSCKEENAKVEQSKSPNGRAYTRTTVHDAHGKAVAEKWIVHGAGHAWSGGTGKGSYTDPTGPDATREMLRFFRTHARNLEKKL